MKFKYGKFKYGKFMDKLVHFWAKKYSRSEIFEKLKEMEALLYCCDNKCKKKKTWIYCKEEFERLCDKLIIV